jgi:hypothetical protein
MGVTYSPRPVPPTAGKKMQPPGNVGSEAVETSRKTKLGKTSSVVENAVKSSKAQDVLAVKSSKAQDVPATACRKVYEVVEG